MRSPGSLPKLVVAVSTAAVLAAGCGNSSSGSSSSSPGAAPGPSAQSSSASPSASLPDNSQLKSALLTASEVGQGFSVDNSSDDNSGGVSGCAALSALSNRSESPKPGQRKEEIQFQNSDDNNPVLLDETLMTEPSDQFQSDYSQYADALASCRKLTVPQDANTKLDLQLTPVNFAPNTTAARFDGQVQNVPVNGYIVLAKPKTNVALFFLTFQTNSGSSQFAFTVFQQAQQKAQSQLPG